MNTTFHYADCHMDYLRLTRMRGLLAIIQNEKEYLYEALNYMAKGKVKVIAETFSLDEIGQAYEKVANGNMRFRALIKE
jgi:D-arabinose 1-dehydrogenase-like Zn-dependent alcohol dehydrogenase